MKCFEKNWNPIPFQSKDLPLRWKRAKRILVNLEYDLFVNPASHQDYLDRAFAIMALCPQHTFILPTRFPENARDYITGYNGTRLVRGFVGRIARNMRPDFPLISWPLTNVWMGAFIKNQADADRNIPPLLQTPASIHFVIAEPLLGPIDFSKIPWNLYRCGELYSTCYLNALTGDVGGEDEALELDWVIVGGLAGSGADPISPIDVRSIRDQCVAAGVPFFFKGWGSWGPRKYVDSSVFDGVDGKVCRIWSHAEASLRVGKKEAGRKLDGRTWDELPKTT